MLSWGPGLELQEAWVPCAIPGGWSVGADALSHQGAPQIHCWSAHCCARQSSRGEGKRLPHPFYLKLLLLQGMRFQDRDNLQVPCIVCILRASAHMTPLYLRGSPVMFQCLLTWPLK